MKDAWSSYMDALDLTQTYIVNDVHPNTGSLEALLITALVRQMTFPTILKSVSFQN